MHVPHLTFEFEVGDTLITCIIWDMCTLTRCFYGAATLLWILSTQRLHEKYGILYIPLVYLWKRTNFLTIQVSYYHINSEP
jgi:hypothetical protein